MSTLVQPLAYTVRECASALRCSERTIHRLVKSGAITPVVRVGRLLRIPSESLRQFVEGAQSNDRELNSTVRTNGKTEAKLKENGNESDSPEYLSQQ